MYLGKLATTRTPDIQAVGAWPVIPRQAGRDDESSLSPTLPQNWPPELGEPLPRHRKIIGDHRKVIGKLWFFLAFLTYFGYLLINYLLKFVN